MKLSRATVIKLLMVHLVTTALTKAKDTGYRGTFKCRNPREEKAREQHSSVPPVESTTNTATSSNTCTKQIQTTTATSGSNMKDCLDVFNAGNTTNGIYTITPTNWTGASFDVFCNMTDGGGWTVFQRRVDGSVNFYRNWTSYKEGFGDPCHEFWLGNDKLSHLTNQGDYEIRIDMVNKDGFPYYAKYDLFRVNDESDNYKLSKLGAYNGTADKNKKLESAGLEYHRNQAFSTYDRDNDNDKDGNCAATYHGAWWYKHCHFSNLNGDYHAVDDNPEQGKRGVSISWKFLPGDSHHIKYTEMKIRPV
ncbi:fibrinogen-like protein A [Apostichopus japonicus]|uniref:fibrinogen-like protein A n=1 Tax=Stichopus japonicus TaxID=307972 RepID=UPI003AB65F66